MNRPDRHFRLSVNILAHTPGYLFTALLASLMLSSLASAQEVLPPQLNPSLVAPGLEQQLPNVPKRERERGAPLPDGQPIEEIPKPQSLSPRVDIPQQRIYVQTIHVEGNTFLGTNALKALISPYERREVTPNELRTLVKAMTAEYFNRGYYTSVVYIPPQAMQKNVLTVRIVEGRVGKITVTGNRWNRSWAIRRDLRWKEHDLLNLKALQEHTRLISQQKPYRVKTILSPGHELGETDLELQVTERQPWQISPAFNNQGRPFIGLYHWGTEVRSESATGIGDKLSAQWLGAAGTQVAAGSYFVPLNRYGTEIGATVALSSVKVDLGLVGKQPEIEGKAFDYSAVITHPLDRRRHIAVDAALNIRRSRSYFADRLTQEDDIRALRFGLNMNETDRFGRSFVRLQTSIAPAWLGSNRQFWSAEVSGIRLLQLPKRNLLIIRGNAQLTPDALPSPELMQIGGAYSVRGYTEGLLSGDRGYNLSVEHRWPIPGLRLVSPWLANRIVGATFFDMGRVWTDTSKSTYKKGFTNRPERTFLMGAGLGVRAQLTQYLQGFIDFGFGLVKRDELEAKAQPTARIHFGIRSDLLPVSYKATSPNGKGT